MWAKLGEYNHWPAQVLAEDDPFIPDDSPCPSQGAVPVRFFGAQPFVFVDLLKLAGLSCQ